MLWLLGYLIVGMIYVSSGMQSGLRKMLKDDEGDTKQEAITIIVMFLVMCIFTPVWPALITMKIASKFHKKEIEK
ncbi:MULTISPECIES: hypothetical protein [Bacillus]|uniref:hypothetical protein n=1 Tax=Bacillus TaxID=1386 RepID=UPI000779F5B1|nr:MULTISPECIES: hypothetical protein [Bacillus]KAB2377117.1 hypothetical protein F8510_06645 [Bacillus sp. RM2(2019)]KXY63026.1 hypothetical protein AT261_30055 [Bacillus cereus]PFH99363.1 hypothetical protein COI64_23915 [Bacillus cereus]PFR27324.1 hypothetical protein COK22_19345 [Bacillus cereus]PFR42914.1 hypothetical protein COK27_09515 [Bacillus thuringiensis]